MEICREMDGIFLFIHIYILFIHIYIYSVRRCCWAAVDIITKYIVHCITEVYTNLTVISTKYTLVLWLIYQNSSWFLLFVIKFVINNRVGCILGKYSYCHKLQSNLCQLYLKTKTESFVVLRNSFYQFFHFSSGNEHF